MKNRTIENEIDEAKNFLLDLHCLITIKGYSTSFNDTRPALANGGLNEVVSYIEELEEKVEILETRNVELEEEIREINREA